MVSTKDKIDAATANIAQHHSLLYFALQMRWSLVIGYGISNPPLTHGNQFEWMQCQTEDENGVK